MTRLIDLCAVMIATAFLIPACSGNGDDEGGPIGPRGGRVSNVGVSVIVPEGALSRDTDLAIETIESGDLAAVPANVQVTGNLFALLPHATEFTAPVTVRIPAAGVAANFVVLYLANPESTEWTTIGGAVRSDDEIVFELDSFSIVGVAALNASTTLSISGIAAPNAAMTADVSGFQVSGTADASGRYTLTIPADQTDAVVSISARVPSSSLALATSLDTVGELLARAGNDLTLDETEYPGTRISALTTVRYAAIYKANGSSLPEDRAALLVAERRAKEHPAATLSVAAAIDRVVEDSSVQLPSSYTTTLDLALDSTTTLSTYIETLFADTGDSGLQAAIERLYAKRELFVEITPVENASYLTSLVRRRNGVIGGVGDRFDFESTEAQRGVYQSVSETMTLAEPNHDFAWTTTDATLRIDLEAPANSAFLLLAPEAVNELVGDPAIEDAILSVGPVQIPRRGVAFEVRGVPGGLRVDWSILSYFEVYGLAEAYAPFNVTLQDVAIAPSRRLAVWEREDRLSPTPITDAMVRGRTWVLRVMAPSPAADRFERFGLGDEIFGHAFVEFRDDVEQSAAITRGRFGDAVAASWSLVDGRLWLDYPDGARQSFAILDEVGNEYGVLSSYATMNDRYTAYARSATVEPSGNLTASAVESSAGQYWQSNINHPTGPFEPDGSLPDWQIFGFQLAAGGSYQQVISAEGLSGGGQYTATSTRVDIETRRDSSGAQCEYSDPSCVALRRRTWFPVKLVDDRLHVLEYRTFITQDFNSATWDGVRYVDSDGMPIDITVYENDGVRPRLNAYYIEDLPQ